MIITEFESIIVVSSELFNAEIFSISEGDDVGLISLLVEEIVWGSSELMCL